MRVKALQDAGHQVSILSMHAAERMEEYDVTTPVVVEEGFVSSLVRRVCENRLGKDVAHRMMYRWRMPRLVRTFLYLRAEHPDVIYVRGQKNMFTVAMMVLARMSCRNVYMLAQVKRYCADTLQKKVTLSILRHIVGVRGIISPIANTCSTQHALYTYVPFAVGIPKETHYISQDDTLHILTIGKFQKRKDIMLLLKVCRELFLRYDFSLTICGNK
jgi:hypothetical protein